MTAPQDRVPAAVAEPEPTQGRVLRSRSVPQVIVVIVALALATWLVLSRSATALHGGPRPAAPDDEALVVDDGGRAMFDGAALEPGVPHTACAAVTYAGPPIAVAVALGADVSDGGIASLIDVVVEEGVGGAAGDCATFRPRAVTFRGTLAELDGTEVGAWSPARGERRGYRVTTTLRHRSIGSANADLYWLATSV